VRAAALRSSVVRKSVPRSVPPDGVAGIAGATVQHRDRRWTPSKIRVVRCERGVKVFAALVCVGAAALCSGTAAVLQAVAARRVPTSARLDTTLVRALARSGTYLGALALIAAGFLLSFVALRTLPVFLVQAGRASSLAVSAVLAAVVLGARLRGVEVVALAGIGVGLVVLATSVAPQPAVAADPQTQAVLAGALVVVVGAAAAALRVRPPARAGLLLAGVGGVAFSVLTVGARTLGDVAPGALVADPVAWTMAAAGALGLVLNALALQRAPVVAASALVVGVETCLASVLGMLLAGDRPARGAELATAGAFALVLVGALVMARFGAPDDRRAAGPPASAGDGLSAGDDVGGAGGDALAVGDPLEPGGVLDDAAGCVDDHHGA